MTDDTPRPAHQTRLTDQSPADGEPDAAAEQSDAAALRSKKSEVERGDAREADVADAAAFQTEDRSAELAFGLEHAPFGPTSVITDTSVESKFVLSPRALAIASVVIALACLTALVIVASIRDADTLATTALALAIIAFGAQLITAFTQTSSTTQQSLRSEQLNTETRALLAEIRATASGTEAMLREQFGQLLRAFMGAAQSAEHGKSAFDPDEFERRLTANIRRENELALAARARPSAATGLPGATGATGATGPTTVTPASRELQRRRREQLDAARRRREQTQRELQFPTQEEAAAVVEDMRQLNQDARDTLRAYADDRIRSLESGVYEGINATLPPRDTHKQLLDHDFLRLVRLGPEQGDQANLLVNQLTEKGRTAARVLTGVGPVPPWAVEFADTDANHGER